MGYSVAFLAELTMSAAKQKRWRARSIDPAAHDDWPDGLAPADHELTVDEVLQEWDRPGVAQVESSQRFTFRAVVGNDDDAYLTYRGALVAALREAARVGATGTIEVFGWEARDDVPYARLSLADDEWEVEGGPDTTSAAYHALEKLLEGSLAAPEVMPERRDPRPPKPLTPEQARVASLTAREPGADQAAYEALATSLPVAMGAGAPILSRPDVAALATHAGASVVAQARARLTQLAGEPSAWRALEGPELVLAHVLTAIVAGSGDAEDQRCANTIRFAHPNGVLRDTYAALAFGGRDAEERCAAQLGVEGESQELAVQSALSTDEEGTMARLRAWLDAAPSHAQWKAIEWTVRLSSLRPLTPSLAELVRAARPEASPELRGEPHGAARAVRLGRARFGRGGERDRCAPPGHGSVRLRRGGERRALAPGARGAPRDRRCTGQGDAEEDDRAAREGAIVNRRAGIFVVLACAAGAACNRAEPTSAPPAPAASPLAPPSPSASPSSRALASADASAATRGVDVDAAPPSRGDAAALAACKSAGATVRFGPAAVSSFADGEALANGLGLRAPGEPSRKILPRACDQDLGNCHHALCSSDAGVSLFWREAVGYVGDLPLLVVPARDRLFVIEGERAVSERDSYCRDVSCVSEVPQVTVVDPRAMHVRVRFENMAPNRAGCDKRSNP